MVLRAAKAERRMGVEGVEARGCRRHVGGQAQLTYEARGEEREVGCRAPSSLRRAARGGAPWQALPPGRNQRGLPPR